MKMQGWKNKYHTLFHILMRVFDSTTHFLNSNIHTGFLSAIRTVTEELDDTIFHTLRNVFDPTSSVSCATAENVIPQLFSNLTCFISVVNSTQLICKCVWQFPRAESKSHIFLPKSSELCKNIPAKFWESSLKCSTERCKFVWAVC